MSLIAMRKMFHNAAVGKWILLVAMGAILVTAYTGIGSTLRAPRGGAASTQETGKSAQDGPNAAVVTVNGIPITRRDFASTLDHVRQENAMMGQQYPTPAEAATMREQALSQTISNVEAYLVARQAGVTATSAEIDRQRNLELGPLRQKLSLPANATVDQVNQALSNYNESVGDLVPDSSLEQQIVLTKYQSAMERSMVADDAAVQQYFRKVHTRHILISNKSRPDAQAQQQAQELVDKIEKGADFATLAKQYSDDPGSKNKGGDDGFITGSTPYVPEFLNAALALKAGEVTAQPVLSPQYGYFIIQALAVQDGTPKDFAKNKAQYVQQVSQQKANQAMQAAFMKVQQTAKVTVSDPLLRAYWSMTQPNAKENIASERSDLNTALASADYSTKAEIYTMLAQLDATSGDTKAQIKNLNNALATIDDAQLRVTLGEAYLKTGDTKSALQQFQTASSHAYNDAGLHVHLQQDYAKMKQTQLAAAEAKWVEDYTKRQRQAGAAPNVASGIPGGAVPVTAGPKVSTTAAKQAAKK